MMNSLSIKTALAIAGIAIPALVTSTAAQSQGTSAPVCPARYEAMAGGQCFNPASGDVVLARVPVTSEATATCGAGYEILVNGLCFDGKTGDITFAMVRTGSTIAAARK